MAAKSNSSKKMVLAALKQSDKPLSISQLMSLLEGLSERTLRRWLLLWVEQGIVKRAGRNRGTRYGYIEANYKLPVSPSFLQGLDNDLKVALLSQLRDLWTHHSTSIEGNTLTLGDTHFLLEQGLTVSGKSLKDHQEIIGHARAIDLIYEFLGGPLIESLVFELHTAVQAEKVADIYKPIGAWKIEVNGAYVVNSDDSQVYIEYALPAHVPALMSEFIDTVNMVDISKITPENAHQVYAKIHMGFVHIHPFWDGNGRVARLLANIPLLKAGLPPLVILHTERRNYIQILADYQQNIGRLTPGSGVWPNPAQLYIFEDFCASSYTSTKILMEAVFEEQKKRRL